jgi:hypothetical protein
MGAGTTCTVMQVLARPRAARLWRYGRGGGRAAGGRVCPERRHCRRPGRRNLAPGMSILAEGGKIVRVAPAGSPHRSSADRSMRPGSWYRYLDMHPPARTRRSERRPGADAGERHHGVSSDGGLRRAAGASTRRRAADPSMPPRACDARTVLTPFTLAPGACSAMAREQSPGAGFAVGSASRPPRRSSRSRRGQAHRHSGRAACRWTSTSWRRPEG